MNKQKLQKNYGMKAAAIKTQLSPHVIRVWEKRYQAVTPSRTETKRRLYSEEDVERLILLRKATEMGHRIGQIANLPKKELLKLIPNANLFTDQIPSIPAPKGPVTVDDLIQAVMDYDGNALQEGLSRVSVSLSRTQMIEKIIVPLIIRVGDLWHEGTLRIAHEHLATSVVRSFLGNLNSAVNVPESAPCLVVTTPAGHAHELGALLAASTALTMGWRTVYLGPNLPTEEICAAAEQNSARAVALSLIYPAGDDRIREELIKLRRLLTPQSSIIIGGRSAASYQETLKQIRAIVVSDLKSFRTCLNNLCQTPLN